MGMCIDKPRDQPGAIQIGDLYRQAIVKLWHPFTEINNFTGAYQEIPETNRLRCIYFSVGDQFEHETCCLIEKQFLQSGVF
jgi:hypothetical protein